MNLLKSHGGVLYGLTTLAALLCGLLICITLLVGFAYAGLAGGEPDAGVDRRYAVITVAAFAATATLFAGLLGVTSHRKVFSVLTIVSTSYLLCLLIPFAAKAVRGQALLLTLPLILAEFSALVLSVVKFKQLYAAQVITQHIAETG